MGSGNWERSSFVKYSTTSKRGVTLDSLGTITNDYSEQDIFKQRNLHASLSPKNVMRECCDTEEHPNTIPVILALDVTGSMGSASLEVAKKLNPIMENLYKEVNDIEFCIMGIGDMRYDSCPVQISQFESDIRIAENVDNIYHEHGGGGNNFESYSLAWYMGLRHTNLNCWNRGKKGIIITLGDETLNPYIPRVGNHTSIIDLIGDELQGDIETRDLYEEASKKFDIYHIHVNHGWSSNSRENDARASFGNVIGANHFKVATLETLPDVIVDIIVNTGNNNNVETTINSNPINKNGGIAWA